MTGCATQRPLSVRRMRTALRSAFQYWEIRRIWCNVALIPAAFFGWFTDTLLDYAVDDIQYLSVAKVAALFLFSGVGANVCYSLIYAFEFWFSRNDSVEKSF